MSITGPFFITLMLLSIGLVGFSQRTTVEYLLQEDGLPSDLVKGLERDEAGFIWAITDDGLAKIEGSEIVRVNDSRHFFDMYKDIHVSNNFGMVAIADSGILSIGQNYKGIHVDYLANQFPISNLIHYKFPKNIYESADSTLWIAFPEQIVQITKNQSVEHRFPTKNYTYNFYRSYQFLEPGSHHFYTLSQKGYLHLYNKNKNVFTEIPWQYEGVEVFYTYKIDNENYLVGCDKGLLQIIFDKGEIVDVIHLEFDHPVSVIYQMSDDQFVIGTWNQGGYILNLSNEKPTYTLLKESDGQAIFDILIDSKKQIWLATNSGILTYRQLVFYCPFKELENKHITNVTPASDGALYLSSENRVYYVDSARQLHPYYTLQGDEITALHKGTKGLTIGTASGRIILKKRDGSLSTFNFADNGEAIRSLVVDKNGDTWFLQNRFGKAALLKMDNMGKETNLTPEVTGSGDHNLNALRLSPTGELLIAAGGYNQYLYHYNYETKSIENRSVPIKELGSDLLWVFDMVPFKDQSLLLASHKGIYQYQSGTMERFDMDFYSRKTIFSLTYDGSNRIWANEANGILCYDNGTTTLYNDADGLPSKFVSPGCLFVDKYNSLWAATEKGLAISNLPAKFKPSSRPVITAIKRSGLPIDKTKENRFLQNALLHFTFASSDYPAKYIVYKYSISNNGEADEWIDVEPKKNFLFFDYLKNGSYQLKIKAKSKGHYTWSEPVVYNFSIYKVWYTRPGFIVGINLIILLLGYWFLRYRQVKGKRQRKELEEIISNRTQELVEQNKKLVQTQNQLIQSEKMATVGLLAAGIAHEINNPVNYVSGGIAVLKKSIVKLEGFLKTYQLAFDKNDKEIGEQIELPNENQINALVTVTDNMFETIEQGIKKTTEIVQSIRVFSSNSENVFAELNVNEILDSILLMLYNKYKGRIEITKAYALNSKMVGVSANIQQVFMNLLTNAIQAIPGKGNIWIKTEKDESCNKLMVSIKDDGMGISEAAQKKIFDPFFSTKDVGKGTGLGLYLTYTFVEQHGGEIKLSSAEGKGTEFIITLPINR